MAETFRKAAMDKNDARVRVSVTLPRVVSASGKYAQPSSTRSSSPTGDEGMVDASSFLAAMRKAVSTVGIVATDGPGGRFGLTVSSMSSLSVEPPSMLVCIHQNSPVVAAVATNLSFCINFVGEGQERISDVFAGRHPAANEDRFSCAEWTTLVTGSPVLSAAAASLDCRVADQHRFGSHILLIGTVVAVLMNGCRVLLYHDRQYRRPSWDL
jgi:flavin reductase (DIM6/NTAB) family NADH-FMN oxidoreductase RutF